MFIYFHYNDCIYNENFIQFLSYIYLQPQISLKKVIYNWLLDI